MSDSSRVKYVGKRGSGESWNEYGFATGTQYRVKVGSDFVVANADLISTKAEQGVLQKYEGNKFKYELVEEIDSEPAPTQTLEAPIPEVVVVQKSVSSVQETIVEPQGHPVLDGILSGLTRALKENDYTVSELNAMIAYETVNQNRRGAINAIEAALEEHNGSSEQTLNE